MIALALLSLAAAGSPAEALLDEVPQAGMLLRCSSFRDLSDTWGGDAFLEQLRQGDDLDELVSVLQPLMDAGLDPDSPLTMVAYEGGARMLMSFGVIGDPQVLVDTLRADVEKEDLEIRVSGDKVLLSGPLDLDDAKRPLGDGSNLPGVLNHVDVSAPGCWIAVDIGSSAGVTPMSGASGAVLFQGFRDQPDRLRLVVAGLEVPMEGAEVLAGEAPWRGPMGASAQEPWMALRLNVDPERLLDTLASLPPMPATQALARGAEQIQESGLRFAPGAEVAVLTSSDGPLFAAVIPVKRPLRARTLPKRMAKRMEEDGLEVGWSDDGALTLGTPGGGVIYVSAARRHLVVASQESVLQEIVSGAGQPWVGQHEALAGEPGVFMRVSFKDNPFKGMLPAELPTEDDNPFESLEGMSASVRTDGGAIIATMEVPGFRDVARQAMLDGMKEAQEEEQAQVEDDPIGEPPSSEAAAVLMLIGARQEEALSLQGSYVPYSGGPRDIDALNGEEVRWDGIPALGVEPMDTACRFEVSLGDGGYTSRAICDQDGDGAQAIFLMTPGGVPSRVTPDGVR